MRLISSRPRYRLVIDMRYNILVLHGHGVYRPPRLSVLNHTGFLERYFPDEHNFLYHRWDEPITNAIRRITFHVVILTTTALRICRHRPREYYYRIRDSWSFLADIDAIKLAFPQDDYHQTNTLDSLFSGLGVDIIYSTLPKYMDMFYPTSRQNAKLKGVLTGYVDDDAIKSTSQYRMSMEERDFDIFHRVTQYPPFGGYFARLKSQMAHRFREVGERAGLRTDISTAVEDQINDERWLQSLGNSRFSLGCESGVSLWDPDGRYVDSVRAYLKEYKHASFEEVRRACFPGEDGRYVFSAVSPRLFESVMMGCSQVLVEGKYLDLLRPWEHYIPVRADMSDVEQAVEAMKDWKSAKRRAILCYENLVDSSLFRYSTFAAEIMKDIDELSSTRCFRPMGPRKISRDLGGTPMGIEVLGDVAGVPVGVRLRPPINGHVVHRESYCDNVFEKQYSFYGRGMSA